MHRKIFSLSFFLLHGSEILRTAHFVLNFGWFEVADSKKNIFGGIFWKQTKSRLVIYQYLSQWAKYQQQQKISTLAIGSWLFIDIYS